MKVTDLLKLNTQVWHNTYGLGKISEIDGEKYIIVSFAACEKRFSYPFAFEGGFLKAIDEGLQSSIMEMIEKSKNPPTMSSLQSPPTTLPQKTNSIDIKKFDSDYHSEYLKQHPILTYKEVEEQFNIKIAGFGRGINDTPTAIVLISGVKALSNKYVYHDHWTANGDYIYSGEGKIGDQKLTCRNKAVIDAEHNRKKIYLLVKFSPKKYCYQGEFSLLDYTYEDAKDEDGNIRKEYKFRLQKSTEASKKD